MANAIDFLGNDDVLNQFMAALVMVQFKADKENTKEILRNLNNGPQHWLLNNTIKPRLDYEMDHDVSCALRHVAVSDNLSYVVLWIPPPIVIEGGLPLYGEGGLRRLTVYKDGQKIKDMWNPPKFSMVYDNLTIDDNGAIYTVDIKNDIYTVDIKSDIYISIYPDYIPQLYKNIDGESIVLSNNAKRYSQFVTTQKTSFF